MAGNAPTIPTLAELQAILASVPKVDTPFFSGTRQQQLIKQYVFPTWAYAWQNRVPTDSRLAGRTVPNQTPNPPASQNRVSIPLIDPATITEWKQGLRCVSKIAAQNANFAQIVRKACFQAHLYYSVWSHQLI